ncbi:MAG: di-heme oxidoredictase family protein [Isosphaeraceae bacterium]
MRVTRSATGLGSLLARATFLVAAVHMIGGGLARADSKSEKADAVAVGYEIFNREWLPNDPRSHGGDGLGPVYNDSSCVACHNSGGSGGAGPVSKNIDILNASRNSGVPLHNQAQNPSSIPSALLDALADVHAGFRSSRTVVLHKFGIDPNYDVWRSQALKPGTNPGVMGGAGVSPFPSQGAILETSVTFNLNPAQGRRASDPATDRAMERLNQVRSAVFASMAANRQPAQAVGPFVVSRSQRNPTPLFGLGLIDSIPEEAILAMEQREAKESPETRGRVSRLKDGRIGRLGWKGQTANVEDFVLNACAVEVGLEVPGHHQAMIPQAPKYRTEGLDLTSEECSALVSYVRSLPQPSERRPSADAEAKHLDSGRAAFASIGCANCHTPKVGNVQGIYSDLLLHDMGQEMGDEGSYGEDTSDDDEPLVPRIVPNLAENATAAPAKSPQPRGATRREWKTPPLWGFRDSGPYLHDGRAQTLEEAVAMHGGQGSPAAQRFFGLSPRDRQQVEAFLKSLVAPSAVRLARNGD